jgi:uncharacterized protein (TIGR00369 family)
MRPESARVSPRVMMAPASTGQVFYHSKQEVGRTCEWVSKRVSVSRHKRFLDSSYPVLREVRRMLSRGWAPPVARLIGFRLTRIGRGTARIELTAGPEHANPMGNLHGGVLCDIADAAMGMSYASLLGKGETFATVELKMNFLRPFWSGRLIANGRVIRKGRTLGLVECRIADQERRLVAYATSTCMTVTGSTRDSLIRPRRGTS